MFPEHRVQVDGRFSRDTEGSARVHVRGLVFMTDNGRAVTTVMQIALIGYRIELDAWHIQDAAVIAGHPHRPFPGRDRHRCRNAHQKVFAAVATFSTTTFCDRCSLVSSLILVHQSQDTFSTRGLSLIAVHLRSLKNLRQILNSRPQFVLLPHDDSRHIMTRSGDLCHSPLVLYFCVGSLVRKS
jgi:hypothetical protein